jgi:hypothetical protein
MNSHEELQQLTFACGGNGGSWYDVAFVTLFETMLISDYVFHK